MSVQRGDHVLVRLWGGYPAIRRVWAIEPHACIVVEDEWFRLLEEGDETWAVGIPMEDVFRLQPLAKPDPTRPFNEWHNQEPLCPPT